MPGPYRVQLLTNFAGVGFSESWFYNYQNTLRPTDITQIKGMVRARQGLYGINSILQAVRIQDISNPRSVQVLTYGNPAKAFDPNDNDTASNAWLCTARNADGGNRRQVWLRGAPDNYVVWNVVAQRFDLVPELVRPFGDFKKSITQSPWSIQGVRPTGYAGTSTSQVDSLQIDALNRAQLMIAAQPFVKG